MAERVINGIELLVTVEPHDKLDGFGSIRVQSDIGAYLTSDCGCVRVGLAFREEDAWLLPGEYVLSLTQPENRDLSVNSTASAYHDQLEMAWVIIANASDWDRDDRAGWRTAAERWRDKYHATLPDPSVEGPCPEIAQR